MSTRPIKFETRKNLIDQMITNMTEKTVQESAYYGDSLVKPFNPDDLYEKNSDYSIYEEMRKDDQVSISLQLKKDLIVGCGWEVVPGEDGQEDIVADLEKALGEDPDVPLDQQLQEMLSCIDFGFSLSEKIFKKREDQSLALKVIKTRHPSTWIIHTDKHGNIEKYEQQGSEGSIFPDPRHLIHMVNNREWQNPYGVSDLRAAYAAYFVKKQVIRYYGIFLEKAASPTPIAKYDLNIPDDVVDKIQNSIKSLQTKTALTIPKELEIEFLEAKSNGEAFQKAINIFNMFIGRALFIPDLLGFQGSETSGGSFALGSEHMDLFFKHIGRRRQYVEQVVNKEIIEPIVFFNHGLIDNYPKFKLRPVREEDAKEAAKVWLDAVKSRLWKPTEDEINHFRGIVNFPEGEIEEVIPNNPLVANQEVGEKDEDNKNAKGKEADIEESGDDEKEKEKKSFARVFNAPEGDFHKRVDFKAAEKLLDSSLFSMENQAKPIINMIFEDLYDQMEKKKIIQNQKIDRVDSIKVKKIKDLKLVLKRNLRNMFNEGQKMAQTEIMKSSFAQPLPTEAFLELLEAETFEYIGKWAFLVEERAKLEMRNAIKDGRPLSSVIDILDESGKKDSLVSLERYSRTKNTEVMNRGRLDFFESTGVVSGYQYSAILDNRTSPICDGLHGKFFKSGTEPVPPLHFNCRSLLIPITQFEEFKPTKSIRGKPTDSFINDNIGKGFGKK